ncbi:MAG TPA: wax ester/triacylglycerol synthase family O-acyltransferase [Anaeromyxobacteraceae bacterium]|nr:wax ester/triacylglycerol synthase family O-acyltransferase [Anaeromyxobacteraceae bacterium]
MRVPFRSVDASWLRMDEAENLMVVTGVLVLGAPVPVEAVRELVEERLLRFRRFRSRVVPPLAGVGLPSWEDDPEFDLDRHVRPVRLAEGAGEPELQAFVSRRLSEPLPAGRPLWAVDVVEGFQGGTAIVARIHHCIGDGMALVHVLLSMADQAPAPEGRGRRRRRSRSLAGWGITLGQEVLRGAASILGHPGRIGDLARLASGSAGALLGLLTLPDDPPTALKGPLGTAKVAAWSRPLELADVKALGRATGSTVNDVLIAALAGAVRRTLAARGEPPRDLEVRGVVPVNLRPPEAGGRLGNRFGLVFLALPVGIEDPLDRLFEVRRRMRALKGTPQALAVYQVLWAMGAAPRPVFDLALRIFAAKGTAVVTNVIGPREPLSIAGAPLEEAMFWVPSAGRLALGVSILSYAGRVWMGLQADATVIPDVRPLLEGFEAELRELEALRLAAEE